MAYQCMVLSFDSMVFTSLRVDSAHLLSTEVEAQVVVEASNLDPLRPPAPCSRRVRIVSVPSTGRATPSSRQDSR